MRVIVLPKGEEKEFPGRRRVADVLRVPRRHPGDGVGGPEEARW